MTAEIVDFLTARLAEAAADAEALNGEQWSADTHIGDEYNQGIVVNDRETIATCGVELLDDGEVRARHIARHDPAHVLADIAAKRRILDVWRIAHDTVSQPGCPDDRRIGEFDGLDEAVRHLAAVYEEHPEYKAEWRP